MKEGVEYEEKSRFEGHNNDFIDIAKTIVAFANGGGGQICLRSVSCDLRKLDSARLDDFVNRWVSPRITGIASARGEEGSWTIDVNPSQNSPHVISHAASYVLQDGKQRAAFHQGQIFVRHSSKSEPATADDVQQMLQRAVSRTLAALGDAITRASVTVAEGGIPISRSGVVLEMAIKNVNKSYPYTATAVGHQIGKGQQWVAYAAEKLGLKTDERYCCNILGSKGQVALRKYSEDALTRIKETLESNPNFDPYH